MGLLRLAVLGAPEVFHDGSRLTFSLRKALALLVYLAVEGGMHPRSKLAAFLWPDSEPHDARAALRNALALLRSQLADPDAAPAQHSHLLSPQELLGLDPQAPLELDLDVVQQAWQQAQRLSTVRSVEQRAALVAHVQHALALVRGPFLDGFWLREDAPFDEWVQQQQCQWQVRLQLLFERLSSWHEAAGEQEQARVTLLRWLALDPLQEEAYRRLMRVHLALGDATSALQVYATCRARLAEELQVKPSPETVALAEHIAERKRVEEPLWESEQLFHNIFRYCNDAIFVVDPARDTIFDVNPQACTLLGYSREELLRMPMSTIHPHEMPQILRFAQEVEQAGYGWMDELNCRTKAGEVIPAEMSASRIDLESRVYMLGLVRDVRERREVERRKDEFFSMASHELRTPLTIIKGTLHLARRRLMRLEHASEMPLHQVSPIMTELSTLLEQAIHQADVQQRLIGDFLDVSRIQVEKLELSPTLCDLVSIVREVVLDQRAITPARTIELELPEVPHVLVMVDQDRIGQVLSNYLTNALKYSATSTPIIVGLVIEAKHVRVWVRDRGPGLSPEQQRRIWERFYQAAGMKAQSDADRGLGLGLHICRALIQQHNGEVGVESTPGYGSTFWFTLPLVGRPEISARSNAKGENA